MLVENSRIRINADGEERLVQELSIADRIVNPITGGYDEISDILQREISGTDPRRSRLEPVLIGKGQLFSGRPRQDPALSPEQVVLMTDLKRSKGRPPVLSCYPAKDISHNRPMPGRDITYFAIFFDVPRFIEVSGVHMRAYTLEDLCHV